MTLVDGEARLNQLGPLPFPLPLGRWAPIVEGVFAGLEAGDWVVPGPRERVGAVLRGCAPERLVDPKDGARPYKVAPATVAPGQRALHAVGLAAAEGTPTLCFLGPASVASGAFTEALNLAAMTAAPALFVIVLPALTEDAPVARQLAASPAALALAFSLPVTTLTNPDAEQVGEAVSKLRGSAAVLEITLE